MSKPIISRGHVRQLFFVLPFGLAALMSHRATARAASPPGPATEPGSACTYFSQGTTGGWKCPIQSISAWDPAAMNWWPANASNIFVDYQFSGAPTYFDEVDAQGCRQTWNGGQISCGPLVKGSSLAGMNEIPAGVFPGSTSASNWDYYYVSIVTRQVNQVCSPATLQGPGVCVSVGNPPNLVGVGWN